jgi:hypothetical protein
MPARRRRVTDPLYFAYGSNLATARLRARVPSAVARGVARAPGYALRLDKLGADGSAKANLRPDRGSEVWGVVYALDPGHWPDLDACEPGYARVGIEVWEGDASLRAQTYLSERFTDALALAWYVQLIRDGASEHGLPEAWRAMLASLRTRDA